MIRLKCAIVLLMINVHYLGFINEVFSLEVNTNLRSEEITPDSNENKIVIPKCCSENKAVVMDPMTYSLDCKNYGAKVLPFADVAVYDKNIHDKEVQKSFSDIYRVVTNRTPDAETFEKSYMKIELIMKPYLNEDGVLYLEYANAYDRWKFVNRGNYCIDYELQMTEDNLTTISDTFKFWCIPSGDPPQETTKILTAALFISSFFLFLVLVVYLRLPELRNLCGMVLMAYVFSLLFAFLFLFIIQVDIYTIETCIRLTTTTYFFLLASFCWMNVMSYDIWWTFRGYAKARPIHRRGETFKFLMYCIYGFGVPLAMSIAFVIINGADLTHMPWFVKPLVPELGCFIEGGQKLVYLYAPMLILIVCNWIFFLMTAFNIWRLNRDCAVLDSPAAGTPQAHRNQRNRLFLYLKLSIIMGINWLLEVVSSFTPDFKFWIITDIYNLLIGFTIFLIFVCKRKIYIKLKTGFQSQKRATQPTLAKSQTSSTTLSNSSQDTPLQVYQHPNGTSKGTSPY